MGEQAVSGNHTVYADSGNTGKRILLAVSGSIAAYKAAILTRLLIKAGHDVRIIMTESAADFITPLTLATLSRHPVYSKVSDADQWNSHVELGMWADAMVVAPATANTIARCAAGIADNMVVATYLSARCPVFFAPAMDLDMWQHPSTRENISTLQQHGARVIPVAYGELASGLIGDGRMSEPEDIFAYLRDFLSRAETLAGKRVLITAGPTQEHIDPVRYIGNLSSGKMGIAIADACAERGATVELVLGPTDRRPSYHDINVIPVVSATDMHAAAIERFAGADIAILAAAVSDYAPVHPSELKIKKTEEALHIALKRTPDIARDLGRMKRNGQIIVGFALETDHAEAHAKAKLAEKNFDFIVLNSLEDPGAGFRHDTNKVKFIFPGNEVRAFELKSKKDVAEDICAAIVELINGGK